MLPRLVLENQFGEVSINNVQSDASDVYNGTSSFQVLPIDLPVGPDAGSGVGSPKFIAPVMGNLLGEDLVKQGAYLGGVIGAYSVLGAKATHYPAGGVIGIVMDGVTAVDGAVVAHLDGDSAQTISNAAFKATMKNSTPGSGFTYGLDLYQAGVDGYPDLAILNADIRFHTAATMRSGSGAPSYSAPKGSIYLRIDGADGDEVLYYNSAAGNNWVAALLTT